MSKLVASNLMSLDGYAAARDGDVMALPFDWTFSERNLELMAEADVLVSGATTFREFLDYWPPVVDDPGQPDVDRAISRRHAEMEHLVVSDTLTADQTGAWRDTTTIVPRSLAPTAVRAAKDSGQSLLLFGSLTTLGALLRERLVDELHLMVGAKSLGDGIPALPPLPEPLRLVEARQLGSSSLALLRYELGTAPATQGQLG